MVASSTTRLQIVNRALLSIGERQTLTTVGAISSPAQKAVDALSQALSEFDVAAQWPWLLRRQAADSWFNEIATVSNVVRLLGVEEGDSARGFTQVQFIEFENFYQDVLTPYVSTVESIAPCVYSIRDVDKFTVNPYPTDAAGRAKILFSFLTSTPIPLVDSGVFAVPERVIPIILKKMSALLSISHLENTQTYQMYNNEYLTLLSNARQFEGRTPHNYGSMFRGNRYSPLTRHSRAY